ncbi:MAG TPA: phospho-sugar mutase [Bacteroidales bacterium]|nr:phosphoglucomutase [Bacteroidales bacterium]HOV54713.1 phospho-sugar mutase [Bacteroidales bacterium]HQE78759.1 phospho-sugar mutase [Bacteroidales bacterium]HRC79028.1 phospho-sugar mutase [Bacteroidales bacterium]HRR53179.1 phospho-sugar mutase [Bacteroidales bacterium]
MSAKNIEPEIIEKINNWLRQPIDEDDKQWILNNLETNPQELMEAFYQDLEFGTGGLRGIIGIGSNRMNKYTVSIATQGLANYILQNANKPFKVVIAYDSRNMSKEFANISAEVLSANEIEVFLFSELRPTPLLSFAVRYLQATAGIVITASHNPKQYNGYKVYWSDGGQLVPPHDKGVIDEVKKVGEYSNVKKNINKSLIHIINDEIDSAYLNQLNNLQFLSEIVPKYQKIVYTPLHGTGVTLVPKALHSWGFDNLFLVEEQSILDGNFPTTKSPNPEEKAAMELAINKAKQIDADLILATDPDADRVGTGIKMSNNEYKLLNGNQIASLLTYYNLEMLKQLNSLPSNAFIVKTIVTTELMRKIADEYNVKTYDVLTGFKYIAELIRLKEGKEKFICGGEESYGFLSADWVRDKDAIMTSCQIAELQEYAAMNGKTLMDILEMLYEKYGYFLEDQKSISMTGIEGMENMKKLMDNYRNNPPEMINNIPVVKILDYQISKAKNIKNNSIDNIDLPKSNVLQFILEDDTKITIRPSGTEPKIKYYFAIVRKNINNESFEQIWAKLLSEMEKLKTFANV